MEVIEKIVQSVSISGLFYIAGVLLLHPKSPLAKEKYNYENFLDAGHRIVLFITFLVALLIFIKIY